MAEIRFGPDRTLTARTLVVLPVLLVVNGVALVAVGAVLGATGLLILGWVAEDVAGWMLEAMPVGVSLSFWLAVGLAWGVGLLWAERNGTRRRLLRRLGVTAASAEEWPELCGTVQRLCAMADIELPAVMVARHDLPNAFLIGRSLCVTEELLRRLTPAELEAVIAHELGHLRHRDGALMEWALSSGVLIFVIIRGLRTAARGDWRLWFVLVPFAAVFGWIYLVNRVLVSLLSRTRELAADRSAAALTTQPSTLASALVKMDADAAQIPATDLRKIGAYSALMCIGPPDGESIAARLVRTHPPLGRRLDRLAAMSRELGDP
jgi:heat shock protein HtpX